MKFYVFPLPFQKRELVYLHTALGLYCFPFLLRCHGYEMICVVLHVTAEVGLCSQQGMKVTGFFIPPISHFFLGDPEQNWSCSVAALPLQMF